MLGKRLLLPVTMLLLVGEFLSFKFTERKLGFISPWVRDGEIESIRMLIRENAENQSAPRSNDRENRYLVKYHGRSIRSDLQRAAGALQERAGT